MISPDFQYFLGTSSPYQVICQRVASCPWSVPWTSCARSFDPPTAARPMTPIHFCMRDTARSHRDLGLWRIGGRADTRLQALRVDRAEVEGAQWRQKSLPLPAQSLHHALSSLGGRNSFGGAALPAGIVDR